MKVNFLVCALTAIVDQATQNISITSIIDQIASPTFPAALPITIVAYLTRQKSEPESAKMRFVVRMDGHKPIMDQAFTIEFQGQLKTRLLAQVGPLIIDRQGILTAELQQAGRTLGSWPIVVKKAGNEILLRSPGSHGRSSRARISKKTVKKSHGKKSKAKKA
jgi:hypothetical protein